MALKQIVKAAVAMSAVGLVALLGLYPGSPKVYANEQDSDYNLSSIGLLIAPDFIQMDGKDPGLVGLGSFIVNAQADCNGCHGSDPANEFPPANNPYFRPPGNFPVKFNQATYLNGGQNFGPAGPGVVQNAKSPLYAGPGLGPSIITRNLTPDFTGNPAGGIDYNKFLTIIRMGHDFDQLHPNCGGTVTDNCYNAPVNGTLLQVMPWPKFQHMTEYQIRAVWTYLSTIPCNAHNDDLGAAFPWLKNQCTP